MKEIKELIKVPIKKKNSPTKPATQANNEAPNIFQKFITL
jgi:hypothetical protein